jgi:HSP20 family molecular chaperone IbpA
MGHEDEFDEVRKIINRMLSDGVLGKGGHGVEPHARGFAVRTGSREERVPRRFIVQIPPDAVLPGPDISATDEAVFVTMDLGGRAPTAVCTKVSGRLLLVEVEGARPLQRVVELPVEVEPEARCAVREGVLDLTFKRRRTVPGP